MGEGEWSVNRATQRLKRRHLLKRLDNSANPQQQKPFIPSPVVPGESKSKEDHQMRGEA
ncbi:hypothetical protein CHS0354_003409 [Potamilus streckersoni]|uniref:Uncharacterized protein n=1 Tax=Potamilus streckersoni TaxID=2493646 RepID=A0AAE0SNS5_9BIVA|nr:hypothetical protein CHS0354_003409 [Potamilus streckersoni]